MRRIILTAIVCTVVSIGTSQDANAQKLFGIDLDPLNILPDADDSFDSDTNILAAPFMLLQPLVEGTSQATQDTANLYMDLHPGWYLAEEWGIVERNQMLGILSTE